MSWRVLKIKLYQPFANFRKPFYNGFADSYPLPPPSTVKGWLHNVLGAKNGEYHEMAVSIAGSYGSVVYDLQKIVVFNKKKAKKDPHTGIRTPREESDVWYIVNLVDVELCIHVNASFETLERIQKNIYSSFWGLGRKEDTMRLDFVGLIEANEINYVDYIQLSQLPHCSMYLKQKTAERLKINGPKFRLNWKYRITPDGLRVFDVRKDLIYVSSLCDSLEPMAYFWRDGENILVDDENIPVDLVGDERYEN